MLYEQVKDLEHKVKSQKLEISYYINANSKTMDLLRKRNKQIEQLKLDLQLAKGREEAYRTNAKELLQYKRMFNSITDCNGDKITMYAVNAYNKMRGK